MNINQQKLKVAELLLPLCPYVTVRKDMPGLVGIPETWFNEQYVTLRIGTDPKVLGIPDFAMDENGWSGTLSQRGVRYPVTVPWEAVTQIFVGKATDKGLFIAGTLAVWPAVAEREEAPKRRGLRMVE